MKKKGKKKNSARDVPAPKRHQPKVGTFGALLQEAIKEKGGIFSTQANGTSAAPTHRSASTAQLNKVDSKAPRKRTVESIQESEELNISLTAPSPVQPDSSEAASVPRLPTAAHLQIYKDNPTQEQELVIGLDFGTSSTKVAIGDPSIATSYLVDFGAYSAFKDQSYLLQTRLHYRNREEKFSITPGDECFHQLKVKLMEAPLENYMRLSDGTSLNAIHLASAYLGLVLKLARKCFFDEHASQYAHSKIDWQLNIGMPSRSYDDTELVNRYRQIALAAWNLSTRPGLFAINDVIAAVDGAGARLLNRSNEPDETIHIDAVNPVPEIVAGFVGYSRSSIRRFDTMHLLVDIGSSTVDVSNVMLSRERGGLNYSFLTAEVESLGGYHLVLNRLATYAKRLEQHLKEISDRCDSVSAPPSVTEMTLSIDEREIDDIVIGSFRQLVSASLAALRNRGRYPGIVHQTPNIPVLLTGGGSRIGQYSEAIPQISSNLAHLGLPRLHMIDFEDFENLEHTGSQLDLKRVGVAYGLSFVVDDLGSIKSPSQVPSIAAEHKRQGKTTPTGYVGASWRHDR